MSTLVVTSPRVVKARDPLKLTWMIAHAHALVTALSNTSGVTVTEAVTLACLARRASDELLYKGNDEPLEWYTLSHTKPKCFHLPPTFFD